MPCDPFGCFDRIRHLDVPFKPAEFCVAFLGLSSPQVHVAVRIAEREPFARR